MPFKSLKNNVIGTAYIGQQDKEDYWVNVMYTDMQELETAIGSSDLSKATTYTGFNNRGKPVITMSKTTVSNHDTLYSIGCFIYSYDYYSNCRGDITPPSLGFYRGAFGFDDVVLLELNASWVGGTGGYHQAADNTGATDGAGMKLRRFEYDLRGLKVSDIEVKGFSGVVLPAEKLDTLWTILVNLKDSYTILTPTVLPNTNYITGLLFNYFAPLALGATYSPWTAKVTVYQKLTQLSHLKNDTSYTWNNATSTYDQTKTENTVLPQPLDTLQRLNILDPGRYQKVSLDSSIPACIGRYTGLSYNNVYGVMNGELGVMQILSAIETDLVYDFNTYYADLMTYSDVTTFWNALSQYSIIRAAWIATQLKLNLRRVPYISALINMLEFDPAAMDTEGMLARAQYPFLADVNNYLIMSRQQTYRFIRFDYSLPAIITNTDMDTLYTHYRDYKGKNGFFYHQNLLAEISAVSLKRLGVTQATLNKVQAAHKKFQGTLLMAQVDSALNASYEAFYNHQGSLSLLDLRKLPLYVGSPTTIELPIGDPKIFTISDISANINNDGKFSCSLSFMANSKGGTK